MSGAIAQVFYGKVPDYITEICREKLLPDLLPILDEFTDRYIKMK